MLCHFDFVHNAVKFQQLSSSKTNTSAEYDTMWIK